MDDARMMRWLKIEGSQHYLVGWTEAWSQFCKGAPYKPSSDGWIDDKRVIRLLEIDGSHFSKLSRWLHRGLKPILWGCAIQIWLWWMDEWWKNDGRMMKERWNGLRSKLLNIISLAGPRPGASLRGCIIQIWL